MLCESKYKIHRYNSGSILFNVFRNPVRLEDSFTTGKQEISFREANGALGFQNQQRTLKEN